MGKANQNYLPTNLSKTFDEENAFNEYIDTFVQRLPRYAIKFKKGYWCTKQKPLKNIPIKAHLTGIYYVSVLPKWYPLHCAFDFDNVKKIDIEKIRDKFEFDWTNSMLCSSESLNGFHLMFKPIYNGKPLTIKLLQDIFLFAKINNFEVFPQINKTFRLPFSPDQICLDFEYKNLKDWKEQLYWFNNLNLYDLKNLKNIPRQQTIFDLEKPIQKQKIGTYQIGKELFKNGLITSNSRHNSQFYVLSYLYRSNILPKIAIEMCYAWLRNKHNGFSKEVNKGNWRTINGEIKRQTKNIYKYYEDNCFYPDQIHNNFNGYITKTDIKSIVMISKGNWSEIKFYTNFFNYCNPRRERIFIDIHTDKLIKWSSRETYLKRLDKLKQYGIIRRWNSYANGKFSKSIKIDKWHKNDPGQAILNDNRTPDTLKEIIKLSYKLEEFKALLQQAGTKRTTAIEIVKRIY